MTNIDSLPMTRLGHDTPEEGVTLVELVGLLAGEPYGSYPPKTLCPVILAFASGFNTELHDDALRTRLLRPLAQQMVGTASSSDIAQRRAFLCADAAVRSIAPLLLEHFGRSDEAARLRALEPVTTRARAMAAHATATAIESSIPKDTPWRSPEREAAIACGLAAEVLRYAAEVPSKLWLVAGTTSRLFTFEELDVKFWQIGADLIAAMCSLADADVKVAEHEAQVSWVQLLEHLDLREDEALLACTSDEELSAYWHACSDASVLLKLYSATGDRQGLVRATSATARAAGEFASRTVNRERIEKILGRVDAWVRGELTSTQYDVAILQGIRAGADDDDENEDDAAACAETAALKAQQSVREARAAWEASESAADAYAHANYDWDAEEPPETFPSLRARAMRELSKLVREQVACPTFEQLRAGP